MVCFGAHAPRNDGDDLGVFFGICLIEFFGDGDGVVLRRICRREDRLLGGGAIGLQIRENRLTNRIILLVQDDLLG